MSVSVAVDQPAPVAGVRFEHMDAPGALEWADAIRRRLGFRLLQQLNVVAVRHGVRLMETDPARMHRFLAYRRRLHHRLDRDVAASVEMDAVRVAGPAITLQKPPVPADWFAPVRGEPHGFIFYVHGGSFIAERSPRLTSLVARFAAAANARVFAPNYRLAPEHPCPAAVEDIAAAFHWHRKTWPDEPIVALGDSAGAAILLSALQLARVEGAEMPDGVVLLSPWVDLSLQSWSVIAASLAGTTPYTMECLAAMVHLYLDGRNATDPVASPLYGDFSDFPPVLIHASKGDILYDDAGRLAERLREAGGDLTVRLWSAETHLWERKPTAKARQSIDLAADFIRRRLD
jgi:acetyl esterase/lipase